MEDRNGIIRRYDITLTELETGSVLSYSTTTTSYNATLLHPNYQYQVEISAVTIGTGPSSFPVILLTPEDGITFNGIFPIYFTAFSPFSVQPLVLLLT